MSEAAHHSTAPAPESSRGSARDRDAGRWQTAIVVVALGVGLHLSAPGLPPELSKKSADVIGASASPGSVVAPTRTTGRRDGTRTLAREQVPAGPDQTELGLAAGETSDSPHLPRWKGRGSVTVDRSSSVVFGRGGRVRQYTVEIEDGTGIDAGEAASTVARTLADDRGWTGTGRPRFQQIGEHGRADMHVIFASPELTDRLCAPMETRGMYSCRSGRNVVLNSYRWNTGAWAYGEDLEAYRAYMVNHEIGHALGYGHRECPRRGASAPIMVQQSITTAGCRANAWPTGDELDQLA